MKQRTIGSILALVVAVGCAAETAYDPAEVEAEIRAEFGAFEQALNAGDYDTALGFYANVPRFVAYEDGKKRYSSWSEVSDALAQLPAYGPGRFEYTEREILVLGASTAMMTARFDTTIGDPPVVSFEGVVSAVVEKIEGKWKMVHIHSSTLQPVVEGSWEPGG